MSTTAPAEIARTLTPGMAVALRRGITWDGRTGDALCRRGLASLHGDPDFRRYYVLTALGRAVAAVLRGGPSDDPAPCPHCRDDDAGYEPAYDLDGHRYCRRCDADLPPGCDTCVWARDHSTQCSPKNGLGSATCKLWEPADSPEEG